MIVTGATTGLGEATAKELAFRKAKVILACRDMEKCEKVGSAVSLQYFFSFFFILLELAFWWLFRYVSKWLMPAKTEESSVEN